MKLFIKELQKYSCIKIEMKILQTSHFPSPNSTFPISRVSLYTRTVPRVDVHVFLLKVAQYTIFNWKTLHQEPCWPHHLFLQLKRVNFNIFFVDLCWKYKYWMLFQTEVCSSCVLAQRVAEILSDRSNFSYMFIKFQFVGINGYPSSSSSSLLERTVFSQHNPGLVCVFP